MAKNKAKPSELERLLEFQMRAAGLPVFETEYRFAAHKVGLGDGIRARLARAGLRDWRFDFAFVGLSLAIEIEGGAFTDGRHTRGKGFSEDLIKYDAAMRLGWTVYRCDGELVKSGRALRTIEQLVERL